MNFHNVAFESSYGRPEQLPKPELPEIAFSGRSNVGKSSMINKIFNRKRLARVSSEPGKTATVNFFRLENVRFADMPGYGYAKVSKAEKQRWAKLMEGYFGSGRDIRLVFQLVDMRHPPTADDLAMINYLIENEFPFAVALTKADKLSKKQREERLAALQSEIPYAGQITMIPFSAETGEGVEPVRAIIEEIAREDAEAEISTGDDCRLFVSESLTLGDGGRLCIGGLDAVGLAEQFGTPLYVMDENLIRKNCGRFRRSIEEFYGGNGMVAFAGKAFCCKEMCRLAKSEGLGLDVVSSGEVFTALSAGFPPERLCFHGNNKTPEDLTYAVSSGVGRIIVDNIFELELLNQIAKAAGKKARVQFRIKPGVEAHTHDYIKTGGVDSKFGFALKSGEAFAAVEAALGMQNIELAGAHCHIGSQIFDVEPFKEAAVRMLEFLADVQERLGYEIAELNLGGGFGIRYTPDDDPAPPDEYMREVSGVVTQACERLGIKTPFIMIEPGRSIAAPAGITLYRVGAVKEIPGVRTYVTVDGGMADNPRYALYKARYDMVIANRASSPKSETYTVAGRCCESGDLLGENVPLQKAEVGDILAVLATGAYNYSMASNYNRLPKPAVVFVKNGEARCVVRRESLEDMIRNDV